MNLYSTFQITSVGPTPETVRGLGIAALFARIAAMTTEALAIQYDGAGFPCPVMEHAKIGDRWSVWSVKNGRWTSVMEDGTVVDDVIVALIDRFTYEHSRDVEYLVCPPGTYHPAFLK